MSVYPYPPKFSVDKDTVWWIKTALHLIHVIFIQHFADFYQTQKMDLANSDKINPYEAETVGCVISLGTGKFPVEPSEGIDVSIHPMKNPMKAAKSLLKSLTNAKNLFVLLLKEVVSANHFSETNSNNFINAENIITSMNFMMFFVENFAVFLLWKCYPIFKLYKLVKKTNKQKNTFYIIHFMQIIQFMITICVIIHMAEKARLSANLFFAVHHIKRHAGKIRSRMGAFHRSSLL